MIKPPKYCGVLFFLAAFLKLGAQGPVSLHPTNPHYFQYKAKPVVLITSGEHYGALMNLDFDYRVYFDELRSKELNLTRVFSGAYVEPPGSFSIAGNTMAPLAGRYITPWARSDEPGYRNGGNKFDLTRWDENYFTRLKDLVGEAAKRDIIIEFTLFCPFYEDTMWIYSPMHPKNNVNGTPDIPRTDVYTLDKSGSLLDIQKALVKKLVTELNAFSNVLFEICNEPYFGGVTIEWQKMIADEITTAEASLPGKHLITQNIANGSAIIEDAHSAVSVFNFHYAYPPAAIQQNYHLNKVIGDNETGFRGTSDSTYRFEGWRFILAGGALYNNLDYSFTADSEKGQFKYPPTQPGGGSDSLRMQLMYLKRFIEKFDFINMKPDSALIDTSAAPVFRYSALSEPGKQYAIYLLNYELKSLELNIPDGKYQVELMDPISGKYSRQISAASKNDKLKLNLPGAVDLAIRIWRAR